jgi:hypothetical protein
LYCILFEEMAMIDPLGWAVEQANSLYKTDYYVKFLLDEKAAREPQPNWNGITDVDDLEKKKTWDRQIIVSALRKLGNCGCGRYVVGRRQGKTRLEWSVEGIRIARIVAGKPAPAHAVAPHTNGEVKCMEHRVLLRPSVEVRLRLPEDMTKDEAEKLAGIVRNLWFGAGANA